MHIVVCIKQVPDTWSDKQLRSDDWTLDRAAADGVLNELDEYALEEALQITERLGDDTTVTALSMGPDPVADTLRSKALAMGADRSVHVVDDALHGSDALITSAVLAAAIDKLQADLVVCGSESTDARMSVVPAMLAERLGWAQLTFARKVEIEGSNVRVERITDAGYDVVEAQLPAVLSVVEKINEPRYPSFKGIMAAKKKPLDAMSVADLGIEVPVGLTGAASAVVTAEQAPPREKGRIITDDGQGGAALADFLAEQKII